MTQEELCFFLIPVTVNVTAIETVRIIQAGNSGIEGERVLEGEELGGVEVDVGLAGIGEVAGVWEGDSDTAAEAEGAIEVEPVGDVAGEGELSCI